LVNLLLTQALGIGTPPGPRTAYLALLLKVVGELLLGGRLWLVLLVFVIGEFQDGVGGGNVFMVWSTTVVIARI
jgi:hypothetical protein